MANPETLMKRLGIAIKKRARVALARGFKDFIVSLFDKVSLVSRIKETS
jgi:hypothetical protein